MDLLVPWQVSGNKPNRCEYEQLSPVEGNNNRASDRNKKSGKNKNDRHRRFGSIDNDGNNGNDDDSSSSSQEDDEDSGKWIPDLTLTLSLQSQSLLLLSDPDRFFNFHFVADEDDDDEEIDRLTCWVCERAFRYIDLFFFKYIFIQIQLIGFHFSSTRILERHKIRERHFGWVGHFLSLPKNRVISAKHDTPLAHIYIRPHLFSPVSFSSPHPSLNPTRVMERSMMGLRVAALVDETYVYASYIHTSRDFSSQREKKNREQSRRPILYRRPPQNVRKIKIKLLRSLILFFRDGFSFYF